MRTVAPARKRKAPAFPPGPVIGTGAGLLRRLFLLLLLSDDFFAGFLIDDLHRQAAIVKALVDALYVPGSLLHVHSGQAAMPGLSPKRLLWPVSETDEARGSSAVH